MRQAPTTSEWQRIPQQGGWALALGFFVFAGTLGAEESLEGFGFLALSEVEGSDSSSSRVPVWQLNITPPYSATLAGTPHPLQQDPSGEIVVWLYAPDAYPKLRREAQGTETSSSAIVVVRSGNKDPLGTYVRKNFLEKSTHGTFSPQIFEKKAGSVALVGLETRGPPWGRMIAATLASLSSPPRSDLMVQWGAEP